MRACVYICILSVADKTSRLWGNPDHLKFVNETLLASQDHGALHTLVAKSNTGMFTYDGIELCGERVTHEIEEELQQLESQGKKVTKLSVVGYSLGGLIARYAIGLLYSRRWFDKLQPLNFTTFATPHLGTRTPLVGWHSELFNALGARTISQSGRQLFLLDNFRDTGRPLLSVMADPDSVFLRALRSFKRKSLYANIINDRTVPFYTAMITPHDPFVQLDAVDINYELGYDNVIVDGKVPATRKTKEQTWNEAIQSSTRNAMAKAPFALAATALLPVGTVFYLANAAYQTYESSKRRAEHEKIREGSDWSGYDLELMIKEGAEVLGEQTIQNLSAATGEEFLEQQHEAEVRAASVSSGHAIASKSSAPFSPDNSISSVSTADSAIASSTSTACTSPVDTPTSGSDAEAKSDAKSGSQRKRSRCSKSSPSRKASSKLDPKNSDAPFPLLALTSEQFAMIKSLNAVGIEKYGVHIQSATHSHAALIVRIPRESFSDGKIVARHWVERFLV